MDTPYYTTTCGRKSFNRGSGQKVIGFTFFTKVNQSKKAIQNYFEGVAGNLIIMTDFYPGIFFHNNYVLFSIHVITPVTERVLSFGVKFSPSKTIRS